MRLIIVALSLFILCTSAEAGTFRDDFEDGNWEGWTAVAAGAWNKNVNNRVSVVDGVLRLDHVNSLGHHLGCHIQEDWREYSFSADMRLVKVGPGGH